MFRKSFRNHTHRSIHPKEPENIKGRLKRSKMGPKKESEKLLP